jgi:DNA-binding transcriptional LysR family regulator
MDWNQLEYFRAVAQTGHVTQASKNLMISQSALSRSIAKLEEELGFVLFDRCGKNIILNSNGHIFLQHVERAIQEIKVGRQIIEDSIRADTGNISLAFLRSLGVNIVPVLLGKFRKLFPQIHFKLYENSSTFLLEQLTAGEIDLCLCPAIKTNESLEWAFLFTEELFVAVPRNHKFAAHSRIHLQEIANEPIITLKPAYGLRILLDRFFKEVGIEPKITFEGEEIMTLAGLVESELGVAIIPHIAGLDQLNIVLLPISTPKCYRTIGIAWNKKRITSHAVQKFKNFVIEYFKP